MVHITKILLKTLFRVLKKRYGNDGLTDRQRKRLAKHYRATAGSKHITAKEREAIRLWRQHRNQI